MRTTTISFAAVLIVLFGCSKEEPPSIELRKTENGEVYIPANLEECFEVLSESISEADVEKIRRGRIVGPEMHFGLGMRLRNEWGLWRGSRLSEYFNKLEIYHPDDMSSIILDSYVRQLRGEPIRLEEQVERYIEYWRENSPPNDFVNPETGHTISRVEDGIISTTLKDGRTIHIGKDQETGDRWHYQYKLGWYKPTPMELREIEKSVTKSRR